jgi:hypothetical protein
VIQKGVFDHFHQENDGKFFNNKFKIIISFRTRKYGDSRNFLVEFQQQNDDIGFFQINIETVVVNLRIQQEVLHQFQQKKDGKFINNKIEIF